MPAVVVELGLMIVWSIFALLYIVIRDRRWRIERRVLSDVLDGTRHELEQLHARCTRGEKERTRILCAVHKFQHANPTIADAIDDAIGEETAN